MTDNAYVERLAAATVYDADGDKVGSVGQVYLDDQTGEPTWATVNTGFFGTSESFVPVQASDLESDGTLRVRYDKDQIKDAPRTQADRHISPEEEDRLYRHYGLTPTAESTRTNRTDGGYDDIDAGGRAETGDAVSVTRSEERLRVGTETNESGRARLRKYVTTEQQSVTVPVQKEVLEVDRRPVEEGTRSAAPITDHGEQVEEVVLREERPVVSKEAVAVEEVSLRTDVVTEEHTVSDEVAREHVEVDGDTQTRSGDRS